MQRLKLAGGVFVLAAIAMLGWCGYAVMLARATSDWTETRCTITRIEQKRGGGRKQRHTRYVEVAYSYAGNGTRYIGDHWNAAETRFHTTSPADVVTAYPIGSEHACWFDPRTPQNAVLDRSLPSAVLWLPWMGVLFGAIGVWIIRRAGSAPSRT